MCDRIRIGTSSLEKYSLMMLRTSGMFVDPPARTTSVYCDLEVLAILMAASIEVMIFWSSGFMMDSWCEESLVDPRVKVFSSKQWTYKFGAKN